MKKFVSTILVSSLVTGCALPGQKAFVTAPSTINLMAVSQINKSAAEISKEESEIIERKLSEVLTYCRPILSGFEKETAEKARYAFWLSMSGLIAGSVIGPALTAKSAAANAPWTSALSGWAGATNFAGQNLKTSGLSGTTIAQTRNEIIKDLKGHIATATDGEKSFTERRDALMKASASCTVYDIAVPTIADAQ